MQYLPTITEEEERLCNAIHNLIRAVPKNEYGFPFGIYRPDLLPMHDYLPESSAIDSLFSLAGVLTTDGRSPSPPSLPVIEGALASEVQGSETQTDEQQSAATNQYRGAPSETSPDEDFDLFEDEREEDDPSLGHNGTATGNGNQPSDQARAVSVPIERIAGFRKDHLRAAFIPLNFEEGYPALPDGRPVWDRLVYEPSQEFTCFQAYLEMPSVNRGTRMLNDLASIMENNELLIVKESGYSSQEFTAKFRNLQRMYYWSLRARAYDLYRSAAHRKHMEFRALEVQESQYTRASALLDRLMDHMEDEDLFWALMTPKVAIDGFKALTGLQRVSAGLPASAPPSTAKGGEPAGQTLEMILRTLAQSGGQQEIDITDREGNSALTARVLQSPDTTKIAQELIIKLTQGQGQSS